MKTLEKRYETYFSNEHRRLQGLGAQFTPEQIEACDAVSQAILDYNFNGTPKPEIPEKANIKLAQVQPARFFRPSPVG